MKICRYEEIWTKRADAATSLHLNNRPPLGKQKGLKPPGKLTWCQRGRYSGIDLPKILQTSTRWKQILDANRNVIDNPKKLVVGQTLVIPARTSSTNPRRTTKKEDYQVAHLRKTQAPDGSRVAAPGQASSEHGRGPTLGRTCRRCDGGFGCERVAAFTSRAPIPVDR